MASGFLIRHTSRILPVLVVIILISSCQKNLETKAFHSYWEFLPDRYWIGPEYWANRLQDWQLKNGRLECINTKLPKRTLHLLPRHLSGRPGSLVMEVTMGLEKTAGDNPEQVWSGFLLAAGSESMDYRRRALIHGAAGNGGGLIAGVNERGGLFLIDNETGKKWNSVPAKKNPGKSLPDSYLLTLELIPKGNQYHLIFTTSIPDSKEEYLRLDTLIQLHDNFEGNLALICNGGKFWFKDWKVKGSKIRVNKENNLGPIIGTQYTLSDGILKLTAQLPPISESDDQTVDLEIRDGSSGKWNTKSLSQVKIPGYTATFRVIGWRDEIRHDYRIRYHITDASGKLRPYYYYGVIVQDPVEKEEIVLAAFTGNSNSHGSINRRNFNFSELLWFPHEELTTYVAKHQPDLLFFSGDNVYEGRPTPPDRSSELNTGLDYLYKWYLFLWAHGNLTRNIPSITIPDDHDVYHGNIWGASGAEAPARPPDGIYPEYFKNFRGHWQQDQGGYKLSPELVNMIQQTQTSHLPDPYDPSPVKQNIGVYYCNINYGRISWAVFEDRKFKSAPGKIHPEYKIVNGFSQIKGLKGELLDSPDAELLGERQLSFIREWAADWKGVDLKVALSQSVFANLSTYPDTFLTDAQTPRLTTLPQGVIPKDYSKAKDMDSNGWPQTGRNKAIDELRKGFALMVGGDQHLGSVIHHGINDWEDAGYSFCVPSIANLWPRRWFPQKPGENHQEGMPAYTGRYLDGFGNRITVHAVSNPYISNKEPAELHDRAPGYGIVKLNKQTQEIILECWPRYSDPEAFNAEQYPGWPVSLQMADNYKRHPREWLPPLHAEGLSHPPVVQIINEITGEIIYTLRIMGYTFQPGVFEKGSYSIHIGEPGTSEIKTISGISSKVEPVQDTIYIDFD